MKNDGRSIVFDSSVLESVKDINTLEEACLEIARMLFVSWIEQLDDELLKGKPKGYKCVGKRKRTLSTRIGDIVVNRRLYVKATKKRKKRRKGRFLLDETLNIRPRRRLTHGLLRLLVSASTRMSFREVEKMLAEAGFPQISHGTIHQEVRYYGLLQRQAMEWARNMLFTIGQDVSDERELKRPPILFIEADGVMVGHQGDQKRLEIKLGVVHEGWEQVGKRRRLISPIIVAGLFQGGEQFWETFSAELAKIYDLTDTIVVINGDGAPWIQSVAPEYFANAIVQLDRFHLIRDLRLAVGAKTAKALMERLNAGEIRVFTDTLESLEPVIPEKKLSIYRKLLSFCKKYPDHLLDYRQRLGDEYKGIGLFGMGAAETMVDKKIANRMKKRGMSWSRDGAAAMAALQMLQSNGQLFSWLDQHPENDVQNPLPQLHRHLSAEGKEDFSEWLRVGMPALCNGTQPWIKALRGLGGFACAV